MAATIFHWGLHPWAIYSVVALALAFFAYNHKLPLTFRSAFYPLLGEKNLEVAWSRHRYSRGIRDIVRFGNLSRLWDYPGAGWFWFFSMAGELVQWRLWC